MRISRSEAFLTPGRVYAALAAFALVILGARILGVFTLYVQADEFVLLQRAVTTERTGALIGGGRPGLGTLFLAPFAAACRNAVDTIVQARLLWTALTVGAAVTFWFLLRGVVPETSWRLAAAVTGLGLWALSPQFIYYSTQVRTDQPAILFGLLGGVALLSSRRCIFWAPVAGVLLGAGFLFSQKLFYVAGLVGVLVAGDAFMRGPALRREMVRTGLAAAGFTALVLVYRQVLDQVGEAPTLLPVTTELSNFEYYRRSIGWDQYRAMLPLLLPQLLVLGGLVGLTAAWVRDRSRHGRELLVSWAVVTAGAAVVLFHAGRFPYFYMVLGLYPAAVGALLVGPVMERVRASFHRGALLAMIWIPLTMLSLSAASALTRDTQQDQQRASLDWMERNFAAEAVGFTNWGVFACREHPWPVRFGAGLAADFLTEMRAQRTQELLEAFRNRQVAFIIPPVEPHPPELTEFWSTRYVHYHGGIHVAGRFVAGEPGWSGLFEVVAPGHYVWLGGANSPHPLEVESRRIHPGETIELDEQGLYELRLPDGGEGLFVLSLPEPPSPDRVPFFDYLDPD